MAGRKKGTPKTGGRIAGKPNRSTQELKELILSVLSEQSDSINESLNRLKRDSDAKYIDALTKLYPFVISKHSDITSDGEKINITWVENKTK